MTEAAPTTMNRTLRRLPNSATDHTSLTDKEVERLIEAARRRGRNGTRDTAAILLAYRHGLGAAEVCSLQWSQGMDGCTSIGPRVRSKAFILAPPRAASLATSPGNEPYVFTTEAGTSVAPGFQGWSDLD
jgi:integrase